MEKRASKGCPKNSGSSDLSKAERNEYLKRHNELRSKEGVPALVNTIQSLVVQLT